MTIKNIHYKNIKWDYDEGDEENLPTEMTLTTDSTVLEDTDEETIVSDMLSDASGFCHRGFDYEVR